MKIYSSADANFYTQKYTQMQKQKQVDVNNNSQPQPQPTVSTPAFKGALGKQFLDRITKNKEATAVVATAVLASITGLLGIKKKEATDVTETFVDEIKYLSTQKTSLINENANLTQKLEVKEREIESLRAEKSALIQQNNMIIKSKNTEIAEKDEIIAKLEKYAAMAKIKSVDDLGVVMPNQVLATLQEAKENNEAAHKSLFEYVMTGKGQEEFLKQIERNEILLKAKKDGIDSIPEVKEAMEEARNSGLVTQGFDSYLTACYMLASCLRTNTNGHYVLSPTIQQQVIDNACALLTPLQNSKYTYNYNVQSALNEVRTFFNNLDVAMQKAKTLNNYEYVSETLVPGSMEKSFRTFKDKDGNLRDYSLYNLANQYWGCARIRTPEGKIISDHSDLK